MPLRKSAVKYLLLAISIAALAACAAPVPRGAGAATLAAAMTHRPVVLLGEVHDNAAQHALRADAMRRLMASGARPALAFEQFGRDRQTELDLARSELLPTGITRVNHLIARGGGAGWNWDFYRPYMQLALDYDLPIIAANLSRADAMRIARDVDTTHSGEQWPEWFAKAHERAVDVGHCKLMPAAMLPSLARAQIARDQTLTHAIRPHIARGVVLLAGNGHVRNDIGVPFFLTAEERARTVTIGLLEAQREPSGEHGLYDFV